MAVQLRAVSSEVKPSEFELARRRWEKVTAERRALKDRLDGCKAAVVLAEHKPGRGEYLSPLIEDRARRYLDGRLPNRELLARQVVELEDELAQAAERYGREAEAHRRAEALRPKHKAAVRRIAKAVEELSAAVEQEREVRRELGELGSTALVDAGCEFGVLSEYGSALSSWNRRLLQAGVLDP
jgi:hypothetical protein